MDLLADIIGMVGMAGVVMAYLLLQLEKIPPIGLLYNALNLAGSCLLFFSLCIHFNLASLVIEVFWMSASIIGLYRAHKRQANTA